MRNKVIFYIILIFTFVIIQVNFLNFISIFGVIPNIVIILIVSIALLEGKIHGAAVGFSVGLCMDALVGVALGFQALLGMLLGFALGNTNKRFFKENLFVMLICTFISTILYESAMFFGSYFYGIHLDFIVTLRNTIVLEALINSVLGLFLFILIVQINKKWFYNQGKNRY
jgi:rod shape-determining protein MreD